MDFVYREEINEVAAEIRHVRTDSIGAEMELEAGDLLLSINDHPIYDLLDYQFHSQEDTLLLEIRKSNGEIWQLEIEKEDDEDLGLEFEGIVFDKMKSCDNHCVFCFVDQLPRRMRRTLYIKDDDYRYSFYYGNFITLTNLTEADWQKIESMHVSPLYISVHCMRGDVRARMLANQRAANIKADLQRLKNANIQIHTQIVLCPGINDGVMLEESIEELAGFHPSVQSVGIVPVGLTGHREKLPVMEPVDTALARRLVELAAGWQKRFRSQVGYGFVYLADEFYLRAGEPLPAAEYYDDYCQLENGIGLSRLLLEEFADLEGQLPEEMKAREVYLLTGQAAIPVWDSVIGRLQQIKGLRIELLPVENHYFGGGVNVTGLLTGSDIIRALGSCFPGKTILLPEIVLRDGQHILLDDMTVDDIMKKSGAQIIPVDGSARDLVEKILNRKLPGSLEDAICQNQ